MIKGIIYDFETGETLVGANIVVSNEIGTNSDIYGAYRMELKPGNYTISFSFIGYTSQSFSIVFAENDTLKKDIYLQPELYELSTAVVSAGKFKQKLSDVTVSMAIIKPDFIESTNTYNMETVIGQIPGVDILDGQANIRGGSGYSYGAGSRVMILVDGLPMLTADVNEVKWNFLPVENIEQVEILKGASSALYGSSALNGVINIRTAYPDAEPATSVNVFSGVYTHAKRKELSEWWPSLPIFNGASFSHSRKINDIDLVVGGNVFGDNGYRELDYEERVRANANFRHRPKNLKGFSYGINSNIQWQNTSDFFIWIDTDSGAYKQRMDATSPTQAFRVNVDPWMSYFDKRNNSHSIKTRFYEVYNRFKDDPDKNNGSDMFFGEYQFQKNFNQKRVWTTGLSGSYGIADSELYGDHTMSNIAVFSQIDWMFFRKLQVSLGLRWERYTLDGEEEFSRPVARAGVSYQAADFTFVRASFGQGYRFPSVAEKYTATTVGAINIFPNPELSSEFGWSTELGIKQGVKISNWTGFVDLAGFWTEYQDMMEFTFGIYKPDSVEVPSIEHLGFKSLNIGQARINGFELGITGSGEMIGIPVTFFSGYTFMNPVDLSSDTLENNMLKYRYRHSFKTDLQVGINDFSIGMSMLYHSFMERIDKAFEDKILGMEIFPGLKDYRLENSGGTFVMDVRLSYQITKNVKVSLLAKNILNKEYMERPGDIRPPRNITIQAFIKLP